MRRILLIAVVLIIGVNASAQIDSLTNRVTFEPPYFTKFGLRVNYSKKIKDRHWLEVGPLLYLSEKNASGADYKRLLGFGAVVYHKYYVTGEKRNYGTYIGYGAMATYFNIKYPLYYVDDYYMLDPVLENEDLTEHFYKVGGDIIIGYDFLFASGAVTGGFYFGLGYRYASTNNKTIKNRFSNFYGDYAWSGNIMLLGLKLGVCL